MTKSLIFIAAFLSLVFLASFASAANLEMSWITSPSDILQKSNKTVVVNVTNVGIDDLSVSLNAFSDEIINETQNANIDEGKSAVFSFNIRTFSNTTIGSHDINISAIGTDVGNSSDVVTKSLSGSFNVIYPYFDGSSSEVEIDKITNSGDIEGEKFYPLEDFDISVKVRNKDSESHEVTVSAVLVYEAGEVEDTEIEKTVKVGKNSYDTVKLNMTIPADVDEGTCWLYVKAVNEDDDGDGEQTHLEFEVQKKEYKVVPTEVEILPQTAQCGDSFSFSARVANIGNHDEDKIKIDYSDDFGNSKSEVVDDMESGDISNLLSFSFNIPKNTTELPHKIILKASYDYDDDKDRYSKSESFIYYIKISGGCFKETRNVSATVESSKAFLGETSVVSIAVTNTGNTFTSYRVAAVADNSWATLSIEPETFDLSAEEIKYINMKITPKQNLSTGNYSLTLKITYAGKTDEKKISVSLQKASKPSKISGFFEKLQSGISKNVLFIIVDIVFVLAIIVLIIALAKSKAPIASAASSQPQLKQLKNTYKNF